MEKYRKKYLKYKKMYMLEKIKLIGGVWSKCLFINAHGSEVPDSTIKLNENQMVVMYYKPHCSLYATDYQITNFLYSIIGSKCNTLNYVTINEIFHRLPIEYSDVFAVYSGNKYDVDFFDKVFDDGASRSNNISIIPNMSFSFENYQKNSYSFSAFSFPVSDDFEIKNKMFEYHYENYKNEFPFKKGEIFYKDYLTDRKGIYLNNYINLFNFIWIISCRSLDYSLHKNAKHIGIPVIIFILYSIYHLVINYLELDKNNIKDIELEFRERCRKEIFESIEYSHDKILFIQSFAGILYDILVKIISINSTLKVKFPYDNKDNLDALNYVIGQLKDISEDDHIIYLIFNNISIIYYYLKYGVITREDIDIADAMAFTYTLSFFIYEKIDYKHIIKPIEDILKSNITDIIEKIPLPFFDYRSYKNIKSPEELGRIKLSDYSKKVVSKIMNEGINIKFRLIEIFRSLGSLIKYLNQIIETNRNTKYHYNMEFIWIKVRIISSLNGVNINYSNFITYRNNIRKVFTDIIRNINTISKHYPIITGKEKINVQNNNGKMVEYDTSVEFRELIKENINNLDNNKLFVNTDESSKDDILFNVDIIKLIDDYKNVVNLLFEEFSNLGINIIHLY